MWRLLVAVMVVPRSGWAWWTRVVPQRRSQRPFSSNHTFAVTAPEKNTTSSRHSFTRCVCVCVRACVCVCVCVRLCVTLLLRLG